MMLWEKIMFGLLCGLAVGYILLRCMGGCLDAAEPARMVPLGEVESIGALDMKGGL